MKYTFKVKEIKDMVLTEGKGYKIFKKKDLLLREDKEDTAYANDMDDMQDAMNDSSTKTAVVSADSTKSDYNPNNDVTVDVNAKSIQDAKTKINQMNTNPLINKLSGAKFKVQLNQSVTPRPTLESRDVVSYSKKELSELLKKK